MPGWFWPAIAGAGKIAGRILFGSKPLIHTTKDIARVAAGASKTAGAREIATAATTIAGRAAQRLGGRALNVGGAIYAGGEIIEAVTGGPGPMLPATQVQQGGPAQMPTQQYPVAPVGFTGPMQPMTRGFRWPMEKPYRGLVRWVDPFGNIYWRRKARRMNVLNPSALRRAHRRVQGFEKFVMRNFTIARRSKVRRKKRRR